MDGFSRNRLPAPVVRLQKQRSPPITSHEEPLNLAAAETVVWTCLALWVLIGDLVNQWHEGTSGSAAGIVWVVKRTA